MNNTDTMPEMTEHEGQLSTEGFVRHMQEKNAAIERDLLIYELANRLRLTDDCRFSYFIESVKSQSKVPPPPTRLQTFEARLQDLAHDLAKCSDPDVQILADVLLMVQTLSCEGRLDEVIATFTTSFPEFYSDANDQPLS